MRFSGPAPSVEPANVMKMIMNLSRLGGSNVTLDASASIKSWPMACYAPSHFDASFNRATCSSDGATSNAARLSCNCSTELAPMMGAVTTG